MFNSGDLNTEAKTGQLTQLALTGSVNTGGFNAGNYNTGYFSTGDYNTGMANTGNINTGAFISGTATATAFCGGATTRGLIDPAIGVDIRNPDCERRREYPDSHTDLPPATRTSYTAENSIFHASLLFFGPVDIDPSPSPVIRITGPTPCGHGGGPTTTRSISAPLWSSTSASIIHIQRLQARQLDRRLS